MNRNRRAFVRGVAASAVAVVVGDPAGAQNTPATGRTAKFLITAGDRSLVAHLADNDTARDFLSLLPLTLTMDDWLDREKTARLPKAISTSGPRSHTYAVGDVILWSPRPSVAIFYRHDGQEIPQPGSIVIGRIESGAEQLNVPGAIVVTFDKVAP